MPEPLPLVCVEDFRRRAAALLLPEVFDYFAGAAGDESSLEHQRASLNRMRICPRVLRTTGLCDLGVEVLGATWSMPLLISPTAFQRMAHPEGEAAMARAAAAEGVPMVLSMCSGITVEEAAGAYGEHGPGLWFQLYIQEDRGFTQAIVERAEAAGCRALVLTVDSPVLGLKERNARNRFVLPEGLVLANFCEATPGGTLSERAFTLVKLGWEDVEWLRARTSLPLLLKGILHPEDAAEALARGADGIFVSNHGGRQLGGVMASIDAVAPVVEIVDGRVPVLMDGGIQRGEDILRALAGGASAVGLGRPPLWGLAVAGEIGVREILTLLREDLARVLALCGCANPQDVSARLIRIVAS